MFSNTVRSARVGSEGGAGAPPAERQAKLFSVRPPRAAEQRREPAWRRAAARAAAVHQAQDKERRAVYEVACASWEALRGWYKSRHAEETTPDR